MKNLLFFVTVSLIALFTACTTQVQPDLPEPETTITTIDDNDEVTLRSTPQECNTLEMNLSIPYVGSQIATLFECRLNEGVNETYVQNNCTFSESHTYNACVDPDNLISNPSTIVLRQKQEVVNNTNDCTPPCTTPDATLGCRTVIFTVTYLNDDNCPGAPDEWEFSITADVYCCG